MSFKHFLTVALLSLSSVIVMAQNKRITGTVVDTNGDPVIGAGVTHVGTTNGVVTDGKGNYVFSVPDGATINVEALGFEPQQFTVASGRNVYDVTLVESATELDETVVVGYGTQRKRLITGSTVNVSGDKLAAVNAVDAFGALQSQAAGVTIVQNSGQPGESYKMTIRGMGTAGSTTPLYVVDGVPGGSIEALSPNDIESRPRDHQEGQGRQDPRDHGCLLRLAESEHQRGHAAERQAVHGNQRQGLRHPGRLQV